jgi:hypothetical protein
MKMRQFRTNHGVEITFPNWERCQTSRSDILVIMSRQSQNSLVAREAHDAAERRISAAVRAMWAENAESTASCL